MDLDTLRARAQRWLADDPDPVSQAELRGVIDALPGDARPSWPTGWPGR